MPQVSVITAAHNIEPYIGSAVESVLGQSFRDLELIVSNDASTDGTAEVLRGFRDPRLRVLNLERCQGPATARNLAVRVSTGRYVAILDGDDEASPGRLEEQVAFLESRPEVALVGGYARCMNSRGEEMATWTPPLTDLKRRLRETNVFIHSTTLYRRAALKGADPYRPAFRFAHDYDLYLRLAERYEIVNLPHIYCRYRLHPQGISMSKLLYQRYLSQQARRLARERERSGADSLQRGEDPGFLTASQLRPALHGDLRDGVVQVYLDWGGLFLDHGDRRQAFQLFLRALKVAPSSAEAWKGCVLSLLGRRLSAGLARARRALLGKRAVPARGERGSVEKP